MERGHAEVLIPFIQAMLEEAGLAFEDLEALAVPLGPGAFTGLRIGLTAAKSLGLSLDIPVIGLGTFDILARQFFAQGGIPVPYEVLGLLIETRRSDFYVQMFDKAGAALTQPVAQEGADIAAEWQDRVVFWAGDAAPRFRTQEGLSARFGYGDVLYPDPAVMIEMAAERLASLPTRQYSGQVLEPLYLRGADVSVSKMKFRSLS